MRTAAIFALSGSLAACTPKTADAPVEPAPAPAADRGLSRALAEAREGVSNPELAALFVDHWRFTLEEDPLFATRLGVRDFDDRLEERSKRAIDRRRKKERELLARAKGIDRAALSPSDTVHHALFVERLEASIAVDVCDFAEWTLSPRSNPVTSYNHLRELHRVETMTDAQNLLARYRAVAGAIDDEIAVLELGAARGLFAPAESARRVLAMANKQLAQPLEDWPMLEPAKAEHPEFAAEELARYRKELRETVERSIRPALERYARFIERRILPHARPDEKSGLSSLPIGEACYRARIRQETTLDQSAKQIHELGLASIAKSDAAIQALGEKLFQSDSLAATLDKLRSDRSLYFESAEQIEQAASEGLALAKARMGDYFGVLPKADCVVRRIPDYEAPFTTIAYYRPPHADGSKPGEYFVNVLSPEVRPRFEARVLAIHESIPGHHLQIAIAQELGGMPAFRKHDGVTAFVEGWGLYTEKLGEEMGLYESDLDRMGMLSFDAWRAGRLVVDTGIHALGWSRSRAKKYLEQHTALSLENVDNEIDRYISWPGQALGYKLGELEIRELRARAERELGERFSLEAFHDAVLTSGAVSLPVLRERVEAWIASQR